MNIAAATLTPGLEGKIPAMFSDAKYLLIIDEGKGRVTATYPRADMTDCDLARKVIYHDCEAILCGQIEKDPFLIIADEGFVTRYNATDMKARDALKKMQRYELELVPDYIGGTGCDDHSSCECGVEEEI